VTTTDRLDDFAAAAFFAGFFAADFAAGFLAAAFFAVFFAVAFAFAFGLVFNFAFPPALDAVFDLALEVARDFDPAFERDVLLFTVDFFFAFAAMVTRLRSRSHKTPSYDDLSGHLPIHTRDSGVMPFDMTH